MSPPWSRGPRLRPGTCWSAGRRPGTDRSPVCGDAVDRQECAVQDHERFYRGGPHRVGQAGCESGQEFDSLGDIAVGRGGSNAESGCERGIRVPHPQMGECEQCLAASAQAPPTGADRTAVASQLLGEEAKGRAGHVDTRRVNKRVKPLVETVLLVENPSTRGFTTLSAQLLHLRGRLEKAHSGIFRRTSLSGLPPVPVRPVGSGKPKSVQRELAGRSVGISWAIRWVGGNRGVGCEAAGFGGDLGIDLVHGSVAVFDDVVLVVEFSEAIGQGQFMSVALVNPEGELPRRELSGEHAACEGSGSGFLTGLAADRIEGEAEFVECCGNQVVDVVVRLGARAGGEDAKAGGVESGDERITGGIYDIARVDFPHAPEGGMVL